MPERPIRQHRRAATAGNPSHRCPGCTHLLVVAETPQGDTVTLDTELPTYVLQVPLPPDFQPRVVLSRAYQLHPATCGSRGQGTGSRLQGGEKATPPNPSTLSPTTCNLERSDHAER